ncbi:DNA polymerase [Tenacibaculum phage PTm5]|uniref:DNA-directed DNA polymerase n=1 Tax=Tenacibaculum phage PTm5 TaxID=2547426 RepID=A0A5S9EQU9_9CAUD|nr:DNA polymerase [Tenacibaculum phage PTm5]
MLINVTQQDASVTLSYVKNNLIEVKTYPVYQYNGIGTYDYRIARYDGDPDIVNNLVHYKDDKKVKRVMSYKFDFDTLREFITQVIPEEDRNEIFTLEMPGAYKCDIEIAVGDGEIFPDPYLAEMVIDSIQITAPNLNTVTITCNPRVKKAGTPEGDKQINDIEDAINKHFEQVDFVKTLTDRIKYSHIVYDSETEMLERWWRLINTTLHAVGFWNGSGFDVPYLWNRCKKLGVDVGMGSPTGEVSNREMWCRHRHIVDDMQIVENFSHDLGTKQSLSLDYISNRIFGVGKIPYDGSFSDLYNGCIIRYMTYGAVDTILQQLIEQNRKYSAGSEAMAYYCKIPIVDVGKTTALVHAVIWDELYKQGKINAEEYFKKEKTPYGGGFVKQPTRKFCMYPVGVDFSALYPRVIQTCNISFENYMGRVRDKKHAEELRAQGYFVAVSGNYYKNDKTYCLKSVQDKFLSERYLYKDLQFAIWQEVVPTLEAELKRRGINPKKL